MRTVALLAALSSVVLAQSDRTSCSIPLDVESEYRSLPSMSDLSRSWEERYAPRRALAKKYPYDWPLQFALQVPILQHSDMGREWDLAIEHYRALPDRALGELLEARLLSPLHRKKSREVLDRILKVAADSPWAHLAMLEWAADPRNGDRTIAQNEFEAFRNLCPEDRYVFLYIEKVHDPEKLKRQVAAMRRTIESAKQRGLEEEDLQRLRTAWTLEIITYGRDHVEDYRTALRSDLDFLRDHPMWDSGTWAYLLSFGYQQILEDSEAIKSLPDEILAHAPKSRNAYDIRKERWAKENPPPKESPSGQPFTDEHQAHGARYLAFSLALLKDFWGQDFAGFDAAQLLPGDQMPVDMVEQLADFALSNAERYPDQSSSWPPLQIHVAEAYVNRKIRLDRVPALIEKGLEQDENQEKYRRNSDAFKNGEQHEDPTLDAKGRAQEILIQHAMVTGQKERARMLLSDFRRQLDQSRPSDTQGRLASRWRRDAFAYQMLATRAGIEVPLDPALLTAPAEPERQPVAPFEAKDLSGKKWSVADLQGKVTYVSIWRTGCGGICRAGLAGVQQLHERWKDRNDRAVLTISVDQNVGTTEEFMKQNEYSFPMIYGEEVAEKFSPGAGWPMAWLIDLQGRRTHRRSPRASDATIPRIEEMADKIAVPQ